MHPIEEALKEVRTLHEQLTHAPAPEFGPRAFFPFPPGQDPVAYAIQEVSQLKRLIEQQVQSASANRSPRLQWVPRASIYGSESRLCFVVELPGVAREDISVSVSAGELCVRGQRKPASATDELKPIVVEEACGSFERRFPMPPWCNPETITARCALGVLTIELNRTDEEQAGEFEIDVA